MNKFIIEQSTSEEDDLIDNAIVDYNISKVPFSQDPAFVSINRVIKDSKGNILAGILSLLYCWNCLYIDVLWVKEECRGSGYGLALLLEVERLAEDKGCKLVHLDTFDFQAKDFYIRQGYEIFGQLEDCPKGHNRYYMKKVLSS